MAVSSFLGIQSAPESGGQGWLEKQVWSSNESGFLSYRNENTELVANCKRPENEEAVVDFPTVIHGYQSLQLDTGELIEFGDQSFRRAHAFFAHPVISCHQLRRANSKFYWNIVSYTKYFARFDRFPEIRNGSGITHFLNVTMNIIAAGSLLMLGLFSGIIFYRRVQDGLTLAVLGGCWFMSIYFGFSVAPAFGIQLSMLVTHKIADLALWLGVFCFFYTFHLRDLLSRSAMKVIGLGFVISAIFIGLGRTGDDIQFGTNIPFPFCLGAGLTILFSTFKNIKSEGFNRSKALTFGSILIFIVCGHIDILTIMGIWTNPVVVPIGCTFALVGASLAVNEKIADTYAERDMLLVELENKVIEKTAHLTAALKEKEVAQAEMIQSAKLASLGTLAAGIAHEINNAINYINGALTPLERKVMKVSPEQDKPSLVKLFAAIQAGTSLTVDIVRSLRTYTGLNQAPVKDVNLAEVAKSVITILHSKANGLKIQNKIPQDLMLYGHQVGFSQILMNILSNAIDAVKPGTGEIEIEATKINANICLEISDNGMGMSEEVRMRMFDPFFTTKGVGKGTGLGMHIVKTEVDRHKGKIEVESEIGQGTKFKIYFPLHEHSQNSEAA